MISDEAGHFLLKTARQALHQFLRHRRVLDRPQKYPSELDTPGGVFVELYKHVPGTAARELKGSAGVLEPERPVLDNLIACAIEAVKDQRFPDINLDELPVIDIEVHVIENLEDITSNNLKDYQKAIELGKDGLLINKGIMKGVLMPTVPIERKWTIKECLENLCLKAGLLKDCWRDPAAKIFKFRPQIFKEKTS